MDHIYCNFGGSIKILTDNGTEFKNKLFKEVISKLGTEFSIHSPKKVEVKEATVKEAIKCGQFLKKSEEDIAEAIDIYKTLGNETFYGPEEDPEDQQEQPQQ